MTTNEAYQIINSFYTNGERLADESAFEEACHYLIDVDHNMGAAVDLGGFYYGKRNYELALKYYTIGAEAGIVYPWLGLGYIWYYGRLGKRDYEQAFYCFAKVLDILIGFDVKQADQWQVDREVRLEDPQEYDEYINAAYKLADMYRAGHFVEKNWDHFAYLVHQLYDLMTDPKRKNIPDYHLPEIELRLADVILNEMKAAATEEQTENEEPSKAQAMAAKDKAKALTLLFDARNRMAWRLEDNAFFGNFSIMKSIVNKIAQLTEIDTEDLDLYDLYHLMSEPSKVTFQHEEHDHTVVSELDGAAMAICLDGKWFRTIDDMMMKGQIDGESIPTIWSECYDFLHTEA